MLILVKLLAKYALASAHISSSSESKPFQSHSKGETPGREELLSRSILNKAFLKDSVEENFMHLIQGIRFGS